VLLPPQEHCWDWSSRSAPRWRRTGSSLTLGESPWTILFTKCAGVVIQVFPSTASNRQKRIQLVLPSKRFLGHTEVRNCLQFLLL
jgi:hypothetical protein